MRLSLSRIVCSRSASSSSCDWMFDFNSLNKVISSFNFAYFSTISERRCSFAFFWVLKLPWTSMSLALELIPASIISASSSLFLSFMISMFSQALSSIFFLSSLFSASNLSILIWSSLRSLSFSYFCKSCSILISLYCFSWIRCSSDNFYRNFFSCSSLRCNSSW